MDVIEKMKIYEDIIKENIEYKDLIQDKKGYYKKTIDEIALLVAEEIRESGMSIPISSEARGNTVSGKTENVRKEDTDSLADEPEVLGEEALDFLEMFG